MSWLPPWSMARRLEWSKVHPWIAGLYGGVLAGLVFGTLQWMDGASVAKAIAEGAFFWLMFWLVLTPFMKLGARRGWGERADAENFPEPTARRLWSRASDRSLFCGLLVFTAFAALGVGLLVSESGNPAVAAIELAIFGWLLCSTWWELRRRRTST